MGDVGSRHLEITGSRPSERNLKAILSNNKADLFAKSVVQRLLVISTRLVRQAFGIEPHQGIDALLDRSRVRGDGRNTAGKPRRFSRQEFVAGSIEGIGLGLRLGNGVVALGIVANELIAGRAGVGRWRKRQKRPLLTFCRRAGGSVAASAFFGEAR